MTTLRDATLVVTALALGAFSTSTIARDGDDIDVTPQGSFFGVHATHRSPDDSNVQASTAASVKGTWHTEVACAVGGAQTCADVHRCDDGAIMMLTYFVSAAGHASGQYTSCPKDSADVPPAAVITPAMVANAFRGVPMPASKLIIQPPKGRTLVNFETNFYTEPREVDRTVRLLGRVIALRIHVDHWSWTFGDGEALDTSDPGAPYPDLRVTHRYLRADPVRVGLSTTYAAQWRVGGIGGGGWQPVTGTVTVASPRQSLDVIEAMPVLVDHQ